ncbi:MAG: tRNA (adenosine(37)-N6)-threonylcarbamoyltransferase complex ATPase subunit type 1 TsaE [Myxococcota bacterium]
MIERVLHSESETLALARALAEALEPGDLVALEGDLGAGKTTFARGAIRALGVPEEIAVTSPTFALLHVYEGRVDVAHADFYRLGDEAELEELGLDEILEGGAVLFVEWGRKFDWVGERATLFIELEIVSDVHRKLVLSGTGDRGAALLAALG